MKLANKAIQAALLKRLPRYPQTTDLPVEVVYVEGGFKLRCRPSQEAIQSLANKFSKTLRLQTTHKGIAPTLRSLPKRRQGNLSELGSFQ